MKEVISRSRQQPGREGILTDTPGIYSGDGFRSLAEVKERAARLAAALLANGVRHGDRYAIVMRNEIGFLEASLAASFIGAVPVPVNWHGIRTGLKRVLHKSACKAAIVHSDLVPGVEQQAPEGLVILEAEVPQEVTAAHGLGEVPATGRHQTVEAVIAAHAPVESTTIDPPMAVIYTSGTTGLAKGILRYKVPPEDVQKRGASANFLSRYREARPCSQRRATTRRPTSMPPSRWRWGCPW